MNRKLYIICIVAVLALGIPALHSVAKPFLADSNTTATIQGKTYLLDNFEPLNNTVVEINSIPPQSIVAKNSTYYFTLSPGDYTITAKYYQNSSLIYTVEKAIRIEDEGDYIFDLLLSPVSENPVTGTVTANMDNSDRTNIIEQIKTNSSITSYLLIAFALFLLLGGGYKLSTKHKKTEKDRSQAGKFNTSGLLVNVLDNSIGFGVKPPFGNIGGVVSVTEPTIEPAENSDIETANQKLPLSTDLLEVLNVIRGYKGRITQKDLRSRLKYSEVKVSLMLSELEKRGLIKKLKNGRENIVILTDEEY